MTPHCVITGYEIFERMAYHGIASNLVIYLTQKLHEGTVTSSNNVTNWVGTVWLTPLLGAYIADTFLGRYWTFIIASAIYFLGMCLLTLAVSLPGLRPPSCGHRVKEVDCDRHTSTFQVGFFYCALYITAVGTGGTKPNISTMGADQFDDFEPKERLQKLSFFNWWMFSVFIGTLFSNTFLIYIQDNVGWEIGYGLPTLGLTVSILVFIMGTRYYRHKPPSDSPLNQMARVLVATARKWKVVVPDEPKELYELSLEEYSNPGMHRIDHTNSLCLLDKAAVKTAQNSPWILCPVTQIEQTKQMIKMIPILLATFIPATMAAQTHTLFIKQGTTLERSIGPHFKIPPGCLSAFVTIFMLTSIVLYDRFFVPFVRRYTKNPRGITLLQRFGIGYMLHIIVMVTACLAERRRLKVAKENEIFEKNQIVPLSIFILLPQFALMGVADTFVEVAKIEFFYDQAPAGMKSLGTAYFTTSFGVGYFLSSFLLKTVADITKKRGKGWILDNLNVSRLDYYYAFFAVLCFLNFLYFLLVAKLFVYNTELRDTERKLHEAIEPRPNKSTRIEEITLDDKASS
ncbi:NRT1 PTR FAMILY -like [Olea europaea subsp. europaea]|uniref:NRT1 PTR FAMILY -like n=1 Tax=Olea europaea subsp. europaea TaxID=158383 RepID=A0A8S0PME5_OLEEU|nr:NRT1 PTR FAMILY -like [Olea europaea subsp. europaea]